ncbi:MAG: glycosyltransferase [Bacteroidales bacterium]|nr:glycosyltransferase [Bacteroidales bacterium]
MDSNINALMMIKVSVIMPVYNSGKYLKTAVESILSQSLTDFELILVDDGSTDGSPDVCDWYASNDNRVIVIHQENGGISNARNAALKIAKGEYVAFCDHDDEYLPGLLEDNYNFGNNNGLDFVKFCRQTIIIDNNKVIGNNVNIIKTNIYGRKDIVDNFGSFLKNRIIECVWDGIFKRQFLLEHNIWFDSFYKSGGEDIDFMFKCMGNVNIFGINGQMYYKHMFRKRFSTSSKPNAFFVEIQEKKLSNLEQLLKKYDLKPDDKKQLYTFYFIKSYLAPYVTYLNLHFPLRQRITILQQIRNRADKYSFLPKTRITLKESIIYCVVHFLFFNKMYRTLLILYSLLKNDNG